MKRLIRNMMKVIGPPLAYFVARALGATLRIKVVGYEQYESHEKGQIFAGWHGKTLVAAILFRGKGVWTIISHSRDGEMQNKIFTRFGFNIIRGSSGKGGAKAAAQSIRVLKKGATLAFTPDGPRGPSGVVQGGVMLMAKKSGAALVPVGVSAARCWKLSTWDSYMIPKPFSKCVIIYGNPIYLSKDANDEEAESARKKLEKSIHKLQLKADTEMGQEPDVQTSES